MQSDIRQKQITKTSIISIAGNLLLCLLKLVCGIFGGSAALVSDALHSGADAVDTIIVLIGVKLASKEDKERYPYGRERMECVAAIILSAVLCFIGGSIGYSAVLKIFNHGFDALPVPKAFTLVIAVISILVKELLYWYMRRNAAETRSDSLMAIAWHNHADALCSLGSFIGILGSRLGYPIMDPLISLLICIVIIKAAISVFKGAIDKMTDQSAGTDFSHDIEALAIQAHAQIKVESVRTRIFGNRVYAEIVISLPSHYSLNDARLIMLSAKHLIEEKNSVIKECIVILESYKSTI